MKKILLSIMCVVLSLSGCGEKAIETPTEAVTEATLNGGVLPIEDNFEMLYASGAGAWGTFITLNADGSFTGTYHDSEMGDSGEGYDSTRYECEFTGKFTDIKMIEDYAFSMKLESVETKVPVGQEWIEEMEDGWRLRYVATDPLGIAGGEEFIFYLPTAPVSELEEEFLMWNPARNEDTEILNRYGLYNVITDAGFYTTD